MLSFRPLLPFINDFPNLSTKPHFILQSFKGTDFVQFTFHLEFSSAFFWPRMWLLVLYIPGSCSGFLLSKTSLQFWPDVVRQSQENISGYKLIWNFCALVWFRITQSTLFQRKYSGSAVWRYFGHNALNYLLCQNSHIAQDMCEAGNGIKANL